MSWTASPNEKTPPVVNVGFGADITVQELAQLIAEVTDYRGRVTFDRSKPDGTPRKLLDSSRIGSLGWKPTISLRDGITAVYHWYVENYKRREAVRLQL
jgi:GDP-L-fucose synthase